MRSSESIHLQVIFRNGWWLFFLLVLALNDRVFKYTDHLPNWLTGKLSDFAGLFVFPLLAAFLLRIKTASGLIRIQFGTAFIFSILKTNQGMLDGLATGFQAVGIPFKAWADPTDLICLIALPISFLILRKDLVKGRTLKNLFKIPLLTAAIFFCLSTSVPMPFMASDHNVELMDREAVIFTNQNLVRTTAKIINLGVPANQYLFEMIFTTSAFQTNIPVSIAGHFNYANKAHPFAADFSFSTNLSLSNLNIVAKNFKVTDENGETHELQDVYGNENPMTWTFEKIVNN